MAAAVLQKNLPLQPGLRQAHQRRRAGQSQYRQPQQKPLPRHQAVLCR